ncbi:hypothetical protein ACFYPT_21740 [Streptomyces sp. NPDC005529]|uniref:hypothetical protein n=1 Tax=unclassified Streptomyces TaxID=2593676 RepID=UPI0033BEABDC
MIIQPRPTNGTRITVTVTGRITDPTRTVPAADAMSGMDTTNITNATDATDATRAEHPHQEPDLTGAPNVTQAPGIRPPNTPNTSNIPPSRLSTPHS